MASSQNPVGAYQEAYIRVTSELNGVMAPTDTLTDTRTGEKVSVRWRDLGREELAEVLKKNLSDFVAAPTVSEFVSKARELIGLMATSELLPHLFEIEAGLADIVISLLKDPPEHLQQPRAFRYALVLVDNLILHPPTRDRIFEAKCIDILVDLTEKATPEESYYQTKNESENVGLFEKTFTLVFSWIAFLDPLGTEISVKKAHYTGEKPLSVLCRLAVFLMVSGRNFSSFWFMLSRIFNRTSTESAVASVDLYSIMERFGGVKTMGMYTDPYVGQNSERRTALAELTHFLLAGPSGDKFAVECLDARCLSLGAWISPPPRGDWSRVDETSLHIDLYLVMGVAAAVLRKIDHGSVHVQSALHMAVGMVTCLPAAVCSNLLWALVFMCLPADSQSCQNFSTYQTMRMKWEKGGHTNLKGVNGVPFPGFPETLFHILPAVQSVFLVFMLIAMSELSKLRVGNTGMNGFSLILKTGPQHCIVLSDAIIHLPKALSILPPAQAQHLASLLTPHLAHMHKAGIFTEFIDEDALPRVKDAMRVCVEVGVGRAREATPRDSGVEGYGKEHEKNGGEALETVDTDSPTGPQAEEIAPMAKTKSCGMCGQTEGQMKMCARCHTVCYCSVECQRKAWPVHRQHCSQPTLTE